MPYIGNTPADKFLTLAKQSFSTSATTSYTLDSAVSSTQDIALFINNVRQSPVDAYTVSGTALTLTSATAGTDEMYCVYLGKTVGTVSPASNSVTTAMIQSNAVTNAKLGSDINATKLTAGLVPTARLGSGTASSSTVLYGDQTYKAEPSGGLVYTGGSSSTSEVGDLTADNVFNSTYQNYLIVYGATVISGSNNTKLQAQVRHGGTTVTASDYASVSVFVDTTTTAGGNNVSSTNGNSVDRITLGADAMSNSANLKTCVGTLYCFDMNASDEHKMFVNDTTNLSWAADFQRGTSGHAYKADQAIDGFKFFANSGNLRCGYFRVYGIVNS